MSDIKSWHDKKQCVHHKICRYLDKATCPMECGHFSKDTDYNLALDDAKGELDKLENHPDVNVNAENAWVKLSAVKAAIEGLRRKR